MNLPRRWTVAIQRSDGRCCCYAARNKCEQTASPRGRVACVCRGAEKPVRRGGESVLPAQETGAWVPQSSHANEVLCTSRLYRVDNVLIVMRSARRIPTFVSESVMREAFRIGIDGWVKAQHRADSRFCGVKINNYWLLDRFLGLIEFIAYISLHVHIYVTKNYQKQKCLFGSIRKPQGVWISSLCRSIFHFKTR